MSHMYYEVQLDFDEPTKRFETLNSIFEYLKNNGHVFVYTSSDEEYLKRAFEEGVDIETCPVYIDPQVRFGDGMFVESVDFWIEEYMLSYFYNPEQRPYIETLLETPAL